MLTVFIFMLISITGLAKATDEELSIKQAVLTAAPQVPPRITRDHLAKIVVNLDAVEAVGRLSDGVDYTF